MCEYCDLGHSLAEVESTDLRGLVKILTTHVVSHLSITAADVLVYDPVMQKFVNAGGTGFRARSPEGAVWRWDETPAGSTFADHEIIRIPNLARIKDKYARIEELIGDGFTMYLAAPLTLHNQIKGVLEIFSRDTLNLSAQWMDALGRIAEEGAIALDKSLLVRRLQRQNTKLTQATDAIFESWAASLELRDVEPQGHSMRVTEVTAEFAHILGFSESDITIFRRGALLHDIGKMGIADSILLKTGQLTDEERRITEQHPVIAFNILSPIELLQPALDIPHYHHERWDGTGYPNRLSGGTIPIAARIFSIIDVWDTLRSDRPYRKGWPEDKARAFINDMASRLFDPDLAGKFLKLLEGGDRRRADSETESHRTYQENRFNL